MKKIAIINKHSFVDVITNSSTELFVSDTDKSADIVREILKEKYKTYRELYDNQKYPGVELEEKLSEILTVVKADKKYIEDSKLKEYWNITIKEGDILIEGTTDNSIPYEFWTVIENIFNAERHHLG